MYGCVARKCGGDRVDFLDVWQWGEGRNKVDMWLNVAKEWGCK